MNIKIILVCINRLKCKIQKQYINNKIDVNEVIASHRYLNNIDIGIKHLEVNKNEQYVK